MVQCGRNQKFRMNEINLVTPLTSAGSGRKQEHFSSENQDLTFDWKLLKEDINF